MCTNRLTCIGAAWLADVAIAPLLEAEEGAPVRGADRSGGGLTLEAATADTLLALAGSGDSGPCFLVCARPRGVPPPLPPLATLIALLLLPMLLWTGALNVVLSALLKPGEGDEAEDVLKPAEDEIAPRSGDRRPCGVVTEAATASWRCLWRTSDGDLLSDAAAAEEEAGLVTGA